MKRYILPLIIFMQSIFANAQEEIKIFGVTKDTHNKTIPYVNIGIAQSIGTVSNDKGIFKLTIPAKCINENLMFSCLGFKSQSISIRNLKANSEDSIIVNLEKDSISLKEFTFIDKPFKSKIMGNEIKHNGIVSCALGTGVGAMIGVLIKNKHHTPFIIKNIGFHVHANTYDSVRIRFMFYDYADTVPGHILSKESIFYTVKTCNDANIIINVRKYNLVYNQDIVIAEQILQTWPELVYHPRGNDRDFALGASFFGATTFEKDRAWNEWEKTKVSGGSLGVKVGLFVDVLY